MKKRILFDYQKRIFRVDIIALILTVLFGLSIVTSEKLRSKIISSLGGHTNQEYYQDVFSTYNTIDLFGVSKLDCEKMASNSISKAAIDLRDWDVKVANRRGVSFRIMFGEDVYRNSIGCFEQERSKAVGDVVTRVIVMTSGRNYERAEALSDRFYKSIKEEYNESWNHRFFLSRDFDANEGIVSVQNKSNNGKYEIALQHGEYQIGFWPLDESDVECKAVWVQKKSGMEIFCVD